MSTKAGVLCPWELRLVRRIVLHLCTCPLCAARLNPARNAFLWRWGVKSAACAILEGQHVSPPPRQPSSEDSTIACEVGHGCARIDAGADKRREALRVTADSRIVLRFPMRRSFEERFLGNRPCLCEMASMTHEIQPLSRNLTIVDLGTRNGGSGDDLRTPINYGLPGVVRRSAVSPKCIRLEQSEAASEGGRGQGSEHLARGAVGKGAVRCACVTLPLCL